MDDAEMEEGVDPATTLVTPSFAPAWITYHGHIVRGARGDDALEPAVDDGLRASSATEVSSSASVLSPLYMGKAT